MPWRFDYLRENDFEEYATFRIESLKNRNDFGTVKRSKAFRELNQFVLGQHVDSPVDSVSLRHLRKIYLPESDSFRYDTIFSFTYSPDEVDPAKR